MSRKSKGINAERDLIHKFWASGWAALRAAGSGSSQFPSPDVLASNNFRKIAIEAKVTKDEKKYFTQKEIEELKYFSQKFGAEPWVAIKFIRKQWVFFTIEDLNETKNNYVISINDTHKAISFEELIE